MSLLKPQQIAQLYAAVAEDGALQRMADVVRAIMDVDSAGLWLIDGGRITEISTTEDVAASLPPYLAYYQALDPWGGARPKVVGRALAHWETCDESKLIETEFYRDFARHYGIRRPLGMVVDLGGGMQATISTNRTCGTRLLSSDDKPLMNEVGFHLRGALQLLQRLRPRTTEGPIIGRALEQLSLGVVICDEAGRILQHNQSAQQFVNERAGLCFCGRGEGMSAEQSTETPQLRRLIQAATAGKGGALQLTGRNGARLGLLATPLPTDDLDSLQPRRALLCIARLDTAPALSDAILRQMFGLSPAQTALCLRLAAGLTFEEAAAEAGIAISTARTHYKFILSKTDSQNLRDLLRLLSKIPPLHLR